MRFRRLALLFLLSFCSSLTTSPAAEFRVTRLIADHAVLQRSEQVPVWGWADPGSQVRVSFNGQEASSEADASGRWQVILSPMDPGGPYEMLIRSGDQVRTLQNLMVGDVWICSGQSNMEWPVARAANAEHEITTAYWPEIRHFEVPRRVSPVPRRKLEGGEWKRTSPETVGDFSAVGYFFGRELYKHLQVPIGLINSTWGGTIVETWTSPESIRSIPEYRPALEELESVEWEQPPSPNSKPTLLYNGMVEPLIPYAFRGVIWYQGESNAGQAYQYRSTFPLLIQDWRQQWETGDFPFLWVQLANFRRPTDRPVQSDWAELREAQSMTLNLPKTGQAVIIDLGEAADIHPRNKQDVAYRLSLQARAVAYGEEIVHSGPVFDSMEIEGDSIRIKFRSVGSGLVVKSRYGYVNGFSVAGGDRRFHWARGEIVAPNEVLISSEEVSRPMAVRYGWADNPADLNLYNREGLPAVPFRTDRWPGITEGRKREF